MQLSHKLLIRCMGALKSAVKSGNAEFKASGDDGGMVKALVELASFCDEQLRLKEDDGNNIVHFVSINLVTCTVAQPMGQICNLISVNRC